MVLPEQALNKPKAGRPDGTGNAAVVHFLMFERRVFVRRPAGCRLDYFSFSLQCPVHYQQLLFFIEDFHLFAIVMHRH